MNTLFAMFSPNVFTIKTATMLAFSNAPRTVEGCFHTIVIRL